MMDKHDKQHVLQKFPKFELSYVKTIHNKVHSDIVVAIPYGKKYYAWFSYYKSNHVCFFLEIGRNNDITNIQIYPVCFHKNLAENTVFYGTFLENRFFFIENIYYYKNKNVSLYPYQKKLKLLQHIFENELKIISFTNKDIIFGLPIMKQNFYDLISIIPYLNYKIYCIQFRNLNQVHGAFNLVYKNTTVSNAYFEVRPSIQNDIYELYCMDKNEKQFYSYSVIPDYKTSVMMNEIFRKIKENVNLDALEESDSEDEFENVNEDKFVNINIVKIMECSFNKTHKKWVPLKIAYNKELSLKSQITMIEKNNMN
tara:strand:- start:313 stop:1248 length:936 start_codon:yes stop_codon:yes gene_type:complete